MPTLAVVGLQWGDEGKGKIIDHLAQEADLVVRAQGGHNAGHSVIAQGKEHHFHLIPSGILYDHTQCYIGDGTVIEPKSLLHEMDLLEAEGISLKNRLFISPYAHVLFLYHQLVDQWKGKEKGEKAIGTTGRGIGPCYVDAVGRQGIRICDFIDPKVFKKKLMGVLTVKNREFEALYGQSPLDEEVLFEEYSEFAERLKPYVHSFGEQLEEAIQSGKKVLFEGAQGALLDVTYGTYPFVTSSHTTSAGLALGAGIGPNRIHSTLGVVKAYTTRVGHGPFPTEFSLEEAKQFLDPIKAREVGTTTGRIRRIGWFDSVLVRYAIRLNGIEALALTKLDVLNSLDSIQICTGYRIGNQVVESPPAQLEAFEEVTPVYESFPGWKEPINEIKSGQELPKHARIFLEYVEKVCGVPIELVSFGPEREKVWVKKKLFYE